MSRKLAGDRIKVLRDGHEERVVLGESKGWAEVFEYSMAKNKRAKGVIALLPTGRLYVIKECEEREPWRDDADATGDGQSEAGEDGEGPE